MRQSDFLSCIGVIALLVILAPLVVVINGWVFGLMWSWYIVPKFGWQDLSLVEAILLAGIVGFLTGSYSELKKKNRYDEEPDLSDRIAHIAMFVARPFTSLAIFYVVIQFWS